MLGGLLGLGGCGFHPLYAPSNGLIGGVSTELAAVYVPVLGERTGQLMRQALQQRLAGSDSGVAKRYELTAIPQLAVEGIAIQRDSSTTRYRINATGVWVLRKLDPAHTVIDQGTSHILDGVDINDQQYFALDLETDAAYKRAVETLADQIVQKVAIVLRRRAETGAT